MAGGNSHQRKMAKKAAERLEKKIANAVVERLSSPHVEASETASATEMPLPRSVKYLRGIGIIGLLLGGRGIVFTTPILFWWAAGFLWLGLLAWAADVWFEPNIGRWLRWVGMALIVLLCSAFTFGIAFYPARLQVVATSHEGKYKSGEVIYGITWDDAMSELRIDITNPTNRDYDRLDLTITPNKLIRDQKQFTAIPYVHLVPLGKHFHFNYTDKTGQITQEENSPPKAYSAVRLLCDRLPSKLSIGIVIAVSELSPEAAKLISPSGLSILSYDPKTDKIWLRSRATSVSMVGEFTVAYRPYKIGRTLEVERQ